MKTKMASWLGADSHGWSTAQAARKQQALAYYLPRFETDSLYFVFIYTKLIRFRSFFGFFEDQIRSFKLHEW